jgi:beta-glucanase (GH16 family)
VWNAEPISARGLIRLAGGVAVLALALAAVVSAVSGRQESFGGTQRNPIAGQGYHKVFDDEFNRLNRKVWDSHIWYDERPHRSWKNFQTVSHGILHLRTSRSFIWHNGGDSGAYPINTVTTKSSRKTFKYGYFEARMKWSSGDGAWPGFWLYSYQHAIDNNQCRTQAGEIDVMEGQGSEPKTFYGTVHSNTNGCAPDDNQNDNNYQPVGTNLTTRFHTYGVKWTPTTVTWYLDGRRTHSASTYPSDNQPMFILLQMWTGGWTKDPDRSTPNVIETQVDWVRVWQQSG